MDAIALLKKYFSSTPEGFNIVLEHSRMVSEKAVRIAKSLTNPSIDLAFIEEAALIHDIGICRINAPDISCFGNAPYISHGIIGREILEKEGFPRHALLCERHIGVGLTVEDIIAQNLPLPERKMVPVSLEERIVCMADLFFSKKPGMLREVKTVEEVRKGLLRFGEHKVAIFDGWLAEFRLL